MRNEPTGAAPGFTLIEVLLALAVIAIALGALLAVAAQGVRSAGHLTDKTIALFVASNRLTELDLLALPLVSDTTFGRTQMADRTWFWRQQVLGTGVDGLQRVDVAVFAVEPGGRASGTDVQALLELSGLVRSAQ